MSLLWPEVLLPSRELWQLRRQSRSGGPAFDGAEQTVVFPAARWSATLTVPCTSRAQVLALRALVAALDGRAGRVLVGPTEVARAPWYRDPLTGAAVTYGRGARDAARDPVYAINPDTSSVLAFSLAEVAAANTVTIRARRDRGGLIEPGMYLSIADRLHVVAGLPDGELAAPGQPAPTGTLRLDVRPWTREAYGAGTPIEFGRPRALMMLASDDTGALELQLARTGVVTLDLVSAP